MKNQLSNLDSRESVLLMYLADELSPRDHAQVEERLSRDGAMRDELESLRVTLDKVGQAIARGPADLNVQADRCAKETIAAMHQWQGFAHHPRLSPQPEELKKLPLPWWLYPVAAAASVLLAAAVFFANVEPNVKVPALTEPVAQSIPDILSSQVLSDLSSRPVDPYAQYAMAEDLAASFDVSHTVLRDALSDSGNVAARREVAALQDLSKNEFASVDWRW